MLQDRLVVLLLLPGQFIDGIDGTHGPAEGHLADLLHTHVDYGLRPLRTEDPLLVRTVGLRVLGIRRELLFIPLLEVPQKLRYVLVEVSADLREHLRFVFHAEELAQFVERHGGFPERFHNIRG